MLIILKRGGAKSKGGASLKRGGAETPLRTMGMVPPAPGAINRKSLIAFHSLVTEDLILPVIFTSFTRLLRNDVVIQT